MALRVEALKHLEIPALRIDREDADVGEALDIENLTERTDLHAHGRDHGFAGVEMRVRLRCERGLRRVGRIEMQFHFARRRPAPDVQAFHILAASVALRELRERAGVRFDEQRAPTARDERKRVRSVEAVVRAHIHECPRRILPREPLHQAELAVKRRVLEQEIFDPLACVHA